MNISDKILAKVSNNEEVTAGEIVNAKVDYVMANDLTGPLAIESFRKIGVKKVWDNNKIVFILQRRNFL